MPLVCVFALLCRFSTRNSAPSQCCIYPQRPAVCPNSPVFSNPTIPLWFGKLFVICSPAIATQPGESTPPCALINPAAVCVYCSAHSASRRVSTCWRHQRTSTGDVIAERRAGEEMGESGDKISEHGACAEHGVLGLKWLLGYCASLQAVILLKCA